MEDDATSLFARLNEDLKNRVDKGYFQEPRDFKSLVEVLKILDTTVDTIIARGPDDSAGAPSSKSVLNLERQLNLVKGAIEDVVGFQQGGLNNSLDTMREVVKEYSKGRDEIQGLRKSLAETQTVLTAKKIGQIPLKELWLKKAELQETLRLVREIENLKNVPHKVHRLLQQKRYYATVLLLNSSVDKMYGEDLVGIAGLVPVGNMIMDLKETSLELCVTELREQIISAQAADILAKDLTALQQQGDGAISDSNTDVGSEYGGGGGGNGGGTSAAGSHPTHYTQNNINNNLFEHVNNANNNANNNPNSSQYAGSVFGENTLSGVIPLPQLSRDGGLKEVDESIEASLIDPSSGGSIYLRLLVKSVSALKCEEDVERLLGDTLYDAFASNALHRIKNAAAAVVLSPRQGGNVNDDDDEAQAGAVGGLSSAVEGRAFAAYATALLDTVIAAISRFLYVCTLLSLSRQQRMNPSSSADGAGGAAVGIDRSDRDRIRRLIFTLWQDLEELVWREIHKYLNDPDVQKISDQPASNANTANNNNNNQQALLRDRNDSNTSADDDMMEETTGLSSRQRQQYGKAILFNPSSAHAAVIYRRVLAYRQQAERLLKEYNLEVAVDNSSKPSNKQQQRPSGSNTTIMTMMKQQQQQLQLQLQQIGGRDAAANQRVTNLLDLLQAFLEQELIPVIQSSINEEMREMQLNPEIFSSPLPPPSSSSSGSVANTINTAPCHAADRAFYHCDMLLRYWQQLLAHREMVSVVLDRLLRGFLAAARDQMDGLTYQWLCCDTQVYSKSLVRDIAVLIADDPLYKQFLAMKVFHGRGMSNLDDLLLQVGPLGGYHKANNNNVDNNSAASILMRSPSSDSGNNSPAPGKSMTTQHMQEILLHPSAAWDFASQVFLISEVRALVPITQQVQSTIGVACIAAACDWLIAHVVSAHNLVIKRNSSRGSQSNLLLLLGSPGGNSSNSNSNSIISTGEQQLRSTVLAALKDLQKLSRHCLAILRAAVQLLCFHYLQKLVNINFATNAGSGSSSSSSGTGDTTAEDAVITALLQQLQTFCEAVTIGQAGSSSILAVLLAPLVTLLPRLMVRCVTVVILGGSGVSGSNSSASGVGGAAPLRPPQLNKTRLLRLIVTSQQQIAALISNRLAAVSDGESRRRVLEQLGEESERARRIVAMLDSSANEVRGFLRKMYRELDRDTARALWSRATERAGEGSFEEVWRDLEAMGGSSNGSGGMIGAGLKVGRQGSFVR